MAESNVNVMGSYRPVLVYVCGDNRGRSGVCEGGGEGREGHFQLVVLGVNTQIVWGVKNSYVVPSLRKDVHFLRSDLGLVTTGRTDSFVWSLRE